MVVACLLVSDLAKVQVHPSTRSELRQLGMNLAETIVLPSLVGSTEYSDEKSNERRPPTITYSTAAQFTPLPMVPRSRNESASNKNGAPSKRILRITSLS